MQTRPAPSSAGANRASYPAATSSIEAARREVTPIWPSLRARCADPNFAASHGGETFDQFYGTNPNLNNAFGKCVSSKAQAPAPTV